MPRVAALLDSQQISDIVAVESEDSTSITLASARIVLTSDTLVL